MHTRIDQRKDAPKRIDLEPTSSDGGSPSQNHGSAQPGGSVAGIRDPAAIERKPAAAAALGRTR